MHGHLSRSIVSYTLKRYFIKPLRWNSLYKRLVNLASGGVYIASRVTEGAVSSYLAFSTLPNSAVIFCCTFLKVTFTGISPAPCSYKARTFLIGSFSLPPRPCNRLKSKVILYQPFNFVKKITLFVDKIPLLLIMLLRGYVMKKYLISNEGKFYKQIYTAIPLFLTASFLQKK